MICSTRKCVYFSLTLIGKLFHNKLTKVRHNPGSIEILNSVRELSGKCQGILSMATLSKMAQEKVVRSGPLRSYLFYGQVLLFFIWMSNEI